MSNMNLDASSVILLGCSTRMMPSAALSVWSGLDSSSGRQKHFRAIAGKVDEEGLDADNSPFVKLALDQVVQVVMDTIQELGLEWNGGVEPECSDQ
jgi:hypothetical protein